jgi:hypothetical protein
MATRKCVITIGALIDEDGAESMEGNIPHQSGFMPTNCWQMKKGFFASINRQLNWNIFEN